MRTHVVACALALLSCVEAGPDETKEPPQQLVLEIEAGDVGAKRTRTVAVRIDKPFDVVVGGSKVRMRLRAKEHRTFDAGGVRFQYPRRFTFSYEKDVGVAIWAIEGPNTMLMLQRYEKQDPAALLKELEKDLMGRFGAGSTAGLVKLKAGDRELAGRRLDIKVAGEALRQDLYAFHAAGGTCVMIVQDSMDDVGMPTTETLAFVELLKKTLKIK